MYIYQIRSTDYSFDLNCQLVHEEKFSKKELKDKVEEAILYIALNAKEYCLSFCYFNFECNGREIIKYMIEEMGFKKLNFTTSYEIRGNVPLTESLKIQENIDKIPQCIGYKIILQDILNKDKSYKYYNSFKRDYDRCNQCKYGGMYDEKYL